MGAAGRYVARRSCADIRTAAPGSPIPRDRASVWLRGYLAARGPVLTMEVIPTRRRRVSTTLRKPRIELNVRRSGVSGGGRCASHVESMRDCAMAQAAENANHRRSKPFRRHQVSPPEPPVLGPVSDSLVCFHPFRQVLQYTAVETTPITAVSTQSVRVTRCPRSRCHQYRIAHYMNPIDFAAHGYLSLR